MSSSSEFSGQKQPAKLLEKPSFSQTCSLLSQYLKEKGNFGDLNLGMTCNIEGKGTPDLMLRQEATTMNLFPIIEKQGDVLGPNMATSRYMKSMDFFPQQSGFASSVRKETVPKMGDSSANKSAATEPQTSQMTIFYGGQVLVFNDFPADKAKDVMLLASKASSQSHTTFVSNPAKIHSALPSNLPRSPVDSISSVPPSSNVIPKFGNNLIKEHVQPPPGTVACDLPIARKASLHRFLEKRKDRIAAKSPYQIYAPAAAAPSKPAENMSWLGLAAQSRQ